MGRDCYQVELLHFLNPYLIWVEVKTSVPTVEYEFEQIGIYGILPLETTLDVLEENLKFLRSDEWMPAASALMMREFRVAKEVRFIPAHVEESKTIFDDNIHKFGEIVIITSDGKQKKLSKLLIENNLALFDVCLFHEELSNGSLKTQLSRVQAKEVIRQIEKYISKVDKNERHVKSVKKQTIVLQTAQEIESALTTINIEKHNLKHETELILLQKLKDLELCKGVDEESVGRAVQSIKLATKQANICEPSTSKNLNSKYLKKKLSLSKEDQKCNDPVQILAATKAFLGDNSTLRPSNTVTKDIRSNEENVMSSTTHVKTQHLDGKVVNMDIDMNYNIVIEGNKYATPHSSIGSKQRHIVKKSPEIRNKKTVAYGPPGLDKKVLNAKPVPSITDQGGDLDLVPTKFEDEEQLEIPTKCSAFGNLDSEVNLKIADTKSLFETNNKLPMNSDIVDNKHNILNVNPPTSDNDENFKIKSESSTSGVIKIKSSILQRKFKIHKQNNLDISMSSCSDTTCKDTSSGDIDKTKVGNNNSDEDELEELRKKLRFEYSSVVVTPLKQERTEQPCHDVNVDNFVNPFKNVDASISVFVDKLVTPALMVHTKMKTRITPRYEIRDVPFNTHIKVVLKNMNVEQPMMLQSVSWYTILRGYSVFLISPMGSGKTLGYLPAVCRLVTDSTSQSTTSVGPTAIIVCATSKSVTDVERLSKMFLDLHKKVLACYAGMEEFSITTALLNGCDLLICTPSTLVRLLDITDFGVDLRRLSTFVLDDCERLHEVYLNEIKFFFLKIKEMLRNRTHKELKVQYVLASRVWCDFMEPLARKVPDTVLCFRAFQECVLYSQCPTAVKLVRHENKIKEVLDFLNEIDLSKKIVIVCRKDEEVVLLEKELSKTNHLVLACNNTMTVHELYNLNIAWSDYQDPSLGPILLCCDNNLTHLNVEDAHSLLHFSLPTLFSTFCKRFSVLNDNYSSIFKAEKENVRIKILLDDTNIEQLPKILNFIKRCTSEVPEALDGVCKKVLAEKDVAKAQTLVPLCDNLLALGECPDFWNCQERHAVLKKYDEPKNWMPKGGLITFKILHYHTAVLYSARLMSNIEYGETTKFQQTYSTLSLRMGIYFSKDSNKRPLGIPKVGDICAVSVQQNFYVRCLVIKILTQYNNGNPNYIRIKLLDEEKYEVSRDIYLYYLPDHLKNVETYVVQVRLSNIQPKDKDITFSDLAMNNLKKITDNDEELYLRGKVVTSLGNCIFVDTLEACQTLSSFNEIVVKYDFKKELLDAHAIVNFDHLVKLKNLCKDINLETAEAFPVEEDIPNEPKFRIIPRWAHLESDISSVFFASAESPGKFFVRLAKFEDCMNALIKDIKKYTEENPVPVKNVCTGDIVLAKFPDDGVYERAKIVHLLCDKVKCFFVDQGDWRDVDIKDLIPISEKLIKQMPFQAIECKLVGIKPAGESWTTFSTNWFCDHCYEENHEFLKHLYVKYFTKEKAESTDGYKYGVALIDTTGDDDVIINQRLIDVNLAQENLDEIHFLSSMNFERRVKGSDGSIDEIEWERISNNSSNQVVLASPSSSNLLFKQPIRSMPLVPSDDESDGYDKWEINMGADFIKPFNQTGQPATHVSPSVNVTEDVTSKVREQISMAVDLKQENNTNDHGTENKLISNNLLGIKSRPKILWKQTKRSITIKILLICDNYDLNIGQRSLEFSANANDTDYSFQFELYGVLNVSKCSHSNKGQYILVKMTKLMPRSWLTLTKDGCLKKWIVYDVDSIDISSDEEEVIKDHLENIVKTMHDNADSDSDDDFIDDLHFRYKK